MFELTVQLHPSALSTALPTQTGDDSELETAEAQLMTACEFIADARVADFRLLCCGEHPWPVDVRTDLSILLEQPLLAAHGYVTRSIICSAYRTL